MGSIRIARKDFIPKSSGDGLIDPNWGLMTSLYVLEPFKVSGGEITDLFWIHLHDGHEGHDTVDVQLIAWSETWHDNPANSPTLPETITNSRDIAFNLLPAGHEFRYVCRGRALTDWIALTAGDTPVEITTSNPGFASLANGIHDLTVDVRGPSREEFQALPLFLHLHRSGFPDASTVAVIPRDHQARSSAQDEARWSIGTDYLSYVSVAATRFRGYPVNPSPLPWTALPADQTDLYLEEMQPHTNLFMPQQMWWEEPPGTPSVGMKFVRAIQPKHEGTEEMRQAYDGGTGSRAGTEFGEHGHRGLPFRDGPRSVAWSSPTIWGQCDLYGGFAFAEAGGPIRYMRPDGEVVTVAGWRIDPAKEAVWWMKPYDTVRENMELRGTWINGQWPNNSGFRLPFDVTIDPLDPNVWYTAGYYDHCVYKITITDRDTMAATVEVLAGDPNHTFGYTDATGTSARFRGPSSLVFDPVADCLYVADQDNDAIRKVTRAGVVTTLFGSPDMGGRLELDGAANIVEDSWIAGATYKFNQNRTFNRANSNFEIASGSPDIYAPFCIRVDSTGRIVLYEPGFSAIRRLDPVTGEAVMLVDLDQNITTNRTPAWLDVDRWGNSGPLNQVYFGVVNTSVLEAHEDRRTNEMWGHCSIAGGDADWLFGEDTDLGPHGWGLRTFCDPPHYPWAVTVDPRGGLILSGIGEHGICRLRRQRSDDPLPAVNSDYYNGRWTWWRQFGPSGAPKPDYTGGGVIASSMKYGSEGHNTLGLTNTWGLDPSLSDAALIAAFELPAALQADATNLPLVLGYLRKNMGGWRCLLQLKCDRSEVGGQGTTNGCAVFPTRTEGPGGTLVVLGTGAVAYVEGWGGTGMQFTPGGQQQTNTAFLKFTGPDIGNVFKANGEICFDVKSARSYADRIALPSVESRTILHVLDDDGTELFRFAIEVQLGDHVKAVYKLRGIGADYTIGNTAGTFDPVFGAGEVLHMRLRWEGNDVQVYQDGVLKADFTGTAVTPSWGADAIFTVGADANFGGGFWCSDDVIDNLYVFGRD